MINFVEAKARNLSFSIMTTALSCAFCTQTSISFVVKVGLFRGWVDVHSPCEGHIKTRINGALPDEYLEVPKLRQFLSDFLRQIHFQQGEIYEATFFKASRIVSMGNAEDRIETERRFTL